MTARDVNADVRARFEEPLDVRRKVLVDSLRASKGWMTGYAEAFVDTYVDDAHADLSGEVRELVEAASEARRVIALDRKALFDCHRNPKTDTVNDAPGIAGLKEYDDALAMLDAALAKHTQERP